MKSTIYNNVFKVLCGAVLAVTAVSVPACSDDQYTPREDLFQPRFVGDEDKRVFNNNDYALAWYVVNDAVSYTAQVFSDNYYQNLVLERELDEPLLLLEDLPYGSRFYVRVRSNAAQAEHTSQWATTDFTTAIRPDYAHIVQGVSRTEIGDNDAVIRWLVDEDNPVDSFSVVAAMNPNLPSFTGYLTPEMKANGFMHLTELNPTTMYNVNLYDTSKPRKYDKPYNEVTFRTTGPAPQVIYVGLTDNLSDLLSAGNQDPTIPEGTEYNLPAGSTYTVSTFAITKGFRLVGPTEGDKPIVIINGTWNAAAGAQIAELTFENLDLRNQAANQYFFNSGNSFSMQSVNFVNCDFHNVMRGFWRHQASNVKHISEIVIDNCWFDRCGWQSSTYGTFNFGSAGKNEIGTYDQIDNLTVRNTTFSRGGYKEDSSWGWGNLLDHSTTSTAIELVVENVTFYDFCVNNRLINISNTERSTVTIRNVIIASAMSDIIQTGSGTTVVYDNNYVTADFPNDGTQIRATKLGVKADGVFANPENGDYTLTDTGSLMYITQAGDPRWIK